MIHGPLGRRSTIPPGAGGAGDTIDPRQDRTETVLELLKAILFSLIAAVGLAAGGQVRAEARIALVIGNSNYSSVAPLDNPSNDAQLIADTLGGLGFEVSLLLDAGQTEMMRGIAQFGRALRDAGSDATGLFYYAGHGVQSFGSNYLLPVDIALADAADLDLLGVEAQSVLRQMYSARNRTNIMILDACRNNPFTDLLDFNESGLAEMQAPTGTFLAYATAPGDVALDGAGANSPFTSSLAQLMPTEGMPIEQMFKQVRVEVLQETNGRQTPWDSSSLTNDFAFVEKERLSALDLEAQQFWNSVKDTRDPVQIMLFLRGYGESRYAGEARGLLSEVLEDELTGKAAPKPSPTVQDPSAEEQKLFEMAQAENSIIAYQTYLDTYPDGVFSEFAQQELVALREKAGEDPAGPGDPSASDTVPAPETAEVPTPGIVTWESPLVAEIPEINGRTMSEIIISSPIFPPIEGLPEEYWKTQQCSNCHEWNRERLCTQAQVYLSLNMQRSLDKQHPFGGALKRNLKAWAAGGCQ